VLNYLLEESNKVWLRNCGSASHEAFGVEMLSHQTQGGRLSVILIGWFFFPARRAFLFTPREVRLPKNATCAKRKITYWLSLLYSNLQLACCVSTVSPSHMATSYPNWSWWQPEVPPRIADLRSTSCPSGGKSGVEGVEWGVKVSSGQIFVCLSRQCT